MKQFHSDQRTVYACEICGKIFKQKGNMTKHMLAHDAAHHYTCEYCNKTFKYPDMLKKHSLLHTQGKAFRCQQCDRSFLVKYELTKHVKEMHSNKVYVCAVCNESCRWKHTMRRHIKRKHPHYTKMAESSQYINSLLRDISEIEQNAFNKIQSELSQQVVSVQPDMTQQVVSVQQDMTQQMVSVQQDMTQQVVSVQQDMTQQVVSQPIVISVDSLTQEQLSALASEHIVTADENGTIHLYNQSQSADGHTVDDLQKLSAILQSAQPQQLMVNNQNLTISLAGGQTIFTPVSLEDTRESNHITTSLLRPNPVEVSQSTRQVVVDQSNQSTSHLPETTVLIAPDGSLTYTNSADQHVAFTDLSHITDGSQDDGNKMMFFNLLSASSESTVQ
ncbi:hypothetical protein EB796_008102 [Bugula neritina]|uniref:C2H2-type domain-containing protein n=1 Tax=Bugula neritina TaxID=10212 RepID=A0A7J7K4M4_BUGNE|nr:hypothetical protein EB796_008102 [Bugula neritina]